jgi:hypothetical protein
MTSAIRSIHARLPVAPLALALLVAACQPGPSVNPSGSRSFEPATFPGGPDESPSFTIPPPSPIPSGPPPTPALPGSTAGPTPAAIRPDSFVMVVTDDLRVRTKPEVSDASVRLEPLLWKGALLFVIDGPVEGSGYWWYLVQPMAEVDLAVLDRPMAGRVLPHSSRLARVRLH